MWHNKKKQSPCHPSYILGVCLPVQVNFILNRHLSRGHRISYRANHLERIDNKLFSGLIGPRHMTASGQLPTKTGGQDASFGLFNLAKAFKHNTIYLAIKAVTTIIHYCYYLMVSGKWRPIKRYRKINITYFIFIQLFSKYFEIFWCFNKFSFHHKCNDAWFLTCKHGIYQSPHKLPNDLRPIISWN